MRLRCMCLVIHAEGDLRLEEQEAGEPGPGQVLVRVGMGGICGSDLHYFHDGGFGTVRIKEPMVLGHEVSGIVDEVGGEVGSEATGFKRGSEMFSRAGEVLAVIVDRGQDLLNARTLEGREVVELEFANGRPCAAGVFGVQQVNGVVDLLTHRSAKLRCLALAVRAFFCLLRDYGAGQKNGQQ